MRPSWVFLLAAGSAVARPQHVWENSSTAIKAPSTHTPLPSMVPISTPASTKFLDTASPLINLRSTTNESAGTSKRGLAYKADNVLAAWSGKPVSWAYNWGVNRGPMPSNIAFIPMVWCPTGTNVDSWKSTASSAISSGARALLAFNEPDNSGQCGISYAGAASTYQEYMNPFTGKATLISPSVSNSVVAGQGLTYLENFLRACNGKCNIDAVGFHWYGDAGNASNNLKAYVNKCIALAKKYGISSVWLTEFGLTNASAQQQADFLHSVLPWLDSNGAVGGYAYFWCGDGSLMAGTAISSPLGQAYAS
ncbi:hypothetical protein NECHADRAFT_77333 [Paecilomyces variotii No. 5]|uniref:Asl1-like glycosyl hydrolase catalytic domain-containing protein n=1 Tax=Byssochlamys spectabilis (strain No. 5 / NBRC 109023) TaxID=1356009 RepID=V5G2G1_BYSSN|nr:hypothetical protein NECHADRAFT_77333 [Paecilomyces variotii No. 5]